MKPNRRVLHVLALTTGLLALPPGADAEPRARPRPVDLVWYADPSGPGGPDGREADRALNPASVVKVATSLWAIERLGPGHRFATIFERSAELDEATGRLAGDLIVRGGGDPDFHVENAFLVAAALGRAGIREVGGHLLVSGDFWIGWEGGSEGRLRDPSRRAERMALRLRDALDSRRWTPATRAEWHRFAARRGLDPARTPRLVVSQGVAIVPPAEPDPARLLLIHESNELVPLLKRFNAWSNNDIERLAVSLGPAAELARWLEARLGLETGAIELETLSGLGTNRMTPRQVVRLLAGLRESLARRGLAPEDLLPLAGCDPGTLEGFPRLAGGEAARALVGKTGTLVHTDGGVAVLAGFARGLEGETTFCVAAPSAGGSITRARRAEEGFVLDLLARLGGPSASACGPAPVRPDADARLSGASDAAAALRARQGTKKTRAAR